MEKYECPELKLSSHGRKMAKFGRPAPEIEGLVAETGSFHLPVREVTITLDDVTLLLHLPILEAFHSFEQFHVDNIVDMLVELLESETYAWGAATLMHMYDNLNEASKSTARQLAGYITLLQCWIYKHFPSIGSALAAEDYDKMRPRACRWTSGRALPVSTYRRRLDKLTLEVMCWIPYGDHRSFREFEVISLFFGHLRWGPLTVIHRPKRVVRQFGYIQTIPPHPTAHSTFVEEMDARWMQFDDYIALVGEICVVFGQCLSDYIEWFYMISHSFMTSAQPGDPPRVLLVQQYDTFVEPDVPQQPVAAAAPDETDVDVRRPRHAVDGYVAIADKLERLLNLRILTEGIKSL
ncbi:Protein MAINTENANCE OF MERISTEMS [Glycine max]|nr:Protein MAINTENANCE OF MERISTEMS [Glycine max]